MAQTSIVTGQYVCLHQTAASVLQRCGAMVVDMVLMGICMVTATTISVSLAVRINETVGFTAAIVSNIAILTYPLVAEIFQNGQTVGKRLMRTRVMCLDGTVPTVSALLVRWLLLYIDMPMGVGVALIALTRNSQRLGDLAAGTTVVTLARDDNFTPFAFNFAQPHYRPTYEAVARLTMRQFQVIARVLYMQRGELRDQKILALAGKVCQTIEADVVPGTTAEQFLATVYNDYQYYMSQASNDN